MRNFKRLKNFFFENIHHIHFCNYTLMPRKTSLIMLFIAAICAGVSIKAEKTVFNHDFSPAEGFVTPQEKPLRDEICLNGSWELQRVDVPADWGPA